MAITGGWQKKAIAHSMLLGCLRFSAIPGDR